MEKVKNKRKTKANALQLRKTVVVLDSLVRKNIKNQYRRSALGIVWTVLNPLLNMIVMAFVFSSIFGSNSIDMDYPVYVLSGNIVFSLMSTATSNSLHSIVDNYDLLTKTRMPYSVFPISQNLSAMVNFGFSLIALILVMLIRIPQGVSFHWTMFMTIMPWLPSLMLFSIGISLVLSAIYVRFRDIKHIYSVVLTLWTYLTPIFYSLSTLNLSPTILSILNLNPMLHYLTYFRNIVMGIVPSLSAHLICYGAALAMLAIGCLVFNRAKKKFILFI